MVSAVTDARICHHCKLVTVDQSCDLCGRKTRVHREAKKPEPVQYCVDCGGEFTPSEVVVLTFRDDPYLQCEDGMLITICQPCGQKRREESDE